MSRTPPRWGYGGKEWGREGRLNNERRGNWSCDHKSNERPKKTHGEWTSDRQKDRHTHRHGDSMTDPAQRADSVKIGQECCTFFILAALANIYWALILPYGRTLPCCTALILYIYTSLLIYYFTTLLYYFFYLSAYKIHFCTVFIYVYSRGVERGCC